MNTSIIYKNHAANYILISMLACLAFFIRAANISLMGGENRTYGFVLHIFSIEQISPWLDIGLCSVVALLISLMLVYFNNRFVIVESGFQHIAFLYIIFSSFIIDTTGMFNTLISSGFIILSMSRLLTAFRNEKAISNAFDAGFLLALASFADVEAVVYIVLLVYMLIQLRPFVWREYFSVLAGFLLPYVFMLFYLYFTDNLIVIQNFLNSVNYSSPDVSKYTTEYLIMAAGPIIIAISGVLYFILAPHYKKVITRRYQSIILFFLFLSGLVALAPFIALAAFVYFVIPLSFLLSHMLKETRNRFIALSIRIIIGLSFVLICIFNFSRLFGI